MEHPIIFLGYSLSDANIRKLITSISQVLSSGDISKLQNRLIFVLWNRDGAEASFAPSVIQVESHSLPVYTLQVPEYVSLFSVLSEVKRRFPVRLLRHLKEHVYELVLTNDPTGKIYVRDIDESDDCAGLDVVLGVGAGAQVPERSYTGFNRYDLLLDVLQLDSSFEGERIVGSTLPLLLKTLRVPIYRYLQNAGFMNADGGLRQDVILSDRIARRIAEDPKSLITAPSQMRPARLKVQAVNCDFDILIQNYSVNDVLMCLSQLPTGSIDLTQLRSYLADNTPLTDASITPSHWAKAVCYYDYLAFGPGLSKLL